MTRILECSSRGDKRFSAFFARFSDGRTIEQIYQAAKVDANGVPVGKGKRAHHVVVKGQVHPIELLSEFYYALWWHYLTKRPPLVEVLREYDGFTDMFDRSRRTWLVSDDHTEVGKGPINSQAEAIAAFMAGREPHQAFR